ncbi:hypothetical protein J26TS2_00520 [Shouchella clausii]|nr:hypothetical protein J26TS2_00520 [Shouchella clausii]
MAGLTFWQTLILSPNLGAFLALGVMAGALIVSIPILIFSKVTEALERRKRHK